ncbi:MAG: ABC transporter ATP-binding protein [Chloroflexota bacterium]
MIRPIGKRIANKYFSVDTPPPTWVPERLKRLFFRLTGGETLAADLIRELMWKYRLFVSLGLGANLFAAFFEGGTMAIFTIALEFISGNEENLSNLGLISDLINYVRQPFGTTGIFLLLISIAVLMQLSRSWFDYASKVAAAYIGAWGEGYLRRRLVSQFTRLSYSDISNYKVGNLSSLIGEVDRIGRFMTFANNFVSHITICLAYSIILLWLSWQLTLLAIVSLLLLSFALNRMRGRIRRMSKQFMRAYVSINERLVDLLSGMRLIHVLGRHDYVIDSIDPLINESIRSRRQALMMRALVPSIVQSITIIGVALFLGGGYFVVINQNDYSLIPRLITFVFIIYRMLPRVTSLNSSLAVINENYPFAVRIADTLNENDKAYIQSGSATFKTLKQEIQFENLKLQYDQAGHPALNNINLTIKRGEMIALVGASGSGKSSIINLLLRLYKPTSGHILIDGVPLEHLSRQDWLNRIGVVDQETFVFNATVQENIRFGKIDASHDEIIRAAQVANAHEFIVRLENGFETVIGTRGYRLSGGQLQRLAIARAVIRDPEMLILDEATSALDSHSERLIQESIERLRSDRTIIVVAHRLSTITQADQIYVLNNGEIVESGSHTELLAANDRYASMWRLQS